MKCQSCGSSSIEYDSAAGNAVCRECGVVTEENTIVSEITFGESSTGAAILQGSLVSTESGRLNLSGHYGKRHSGQSREKTLSNGRRCIGSIGAALRLSERFKEAAHRYYTLAVNINFNKGRPTQNLCAACIYIVCRQERSSHMLMDFSDILQTNVFLLGVTFAKLVQALNLIIPMVDPSMYIARFAMLLEFGNKTNRVIDDAMRLVQRMNRDWIQTGRRPAGICGACLLIAARMHNFHRTYSEIIQVAKVGAGTIQHRLREFKNTPSSELSLTDFRNVWLEETCNPPAFERGRKRKARDSETAEMKLTITVETEDGRGGVKSTRLFDPNAESESGLNPGAKGLEGGGGGKAGSGDDADGDGEEDPFGFNWAMRQNPLKMNERDRALLAEINQFDVSKWDNFDDDEIRGTLLTAPEVEEKTAVWMDNNADYLKEQAIRATLAANRARLPGARKRRTKKGPDGMGGRGGGGPGGGGWGTGPASSAMEATQRLLSSKKLSKKINYSVLENLFAENADRKPEIIAAAQFAPATGLPQRNGATPTTGSPAISLRASPDATAIPTGVDGQEEMLEITGTVAGGAHEPELSDVDEISDLDDELPRPSGADAYLDEYDQYNDDD
ncbi:cyclin-like protein [Dimargaris cristalligena]|uniref:B-related factor 1 n=1 Tax=Dimargaris cristalligena TaxID=215637 RepID=A0A4P9ZMH8_9FUNG|nr:cyclin-like protein [Dimargaris cristalligena]|eukprot:RKP34298.1 cyclin-like protein [Dimargaris cristalligena]